MKIQVLGIACAAALGLAVVGAAAPASAVIVNIDATSTGELFTVAPGEYAVSWIGTAQGGAFNGWSGLDYTYAPSMTVPVSGWFEAFDAEDVANPGVETHYPTGATPASTALAALAQAQAATTVTHVFNGHFDYISANPFTFTINVPTTYRLSVADSPGHFADNLGGVSLSIVPVPEAPTWLSLIAGLAAIGAASRAPRLKRNPRASA